MSIRLSLAAAVGVLLTTAGCASPAPGRLRGSSPAPGVSLSNASRPPLTGTEWQLASYSNPGSSRRVTVTTDSTAEFSTKGSFRAPACNYLGGDVTIISDRILFSTVVTTMMACGREPGQLNRQVEATLTRSVSWAITGRVLTLTNPDGHVLIYRVRPSIYPAPKSGNRNNTVANDSAAPSMALVSTATTTLLSGQTSVRVMPGITTTVAEKFAVPMRLRKHSEPITNLGVLDCQLQ